MQGVATIKPDDGIVVTDGAVTATASYTERLKQVIGNLRANEALVAEFYDLDARIKRKRYDALLDAGFTPAEAVELCKGNNV